MEAGFFSTDGIIVIQYLVVVVYNVFMALPEFFLKKNNGSLNQIRKKG